MRLKIKNSNRSRWHMKTTCIIIFSSVAFGCNKPQFVYKSSNFNNLHTIKSLNIDANPNKEMYVWDMHQYPCDHVINLTKKHLISKNYSFTHANNADCCVKISYFIPNSNHRQAKTVLAIEIIDNMSCERIWFGYAELPTSKIPCNDEPLDTHIKKFLDNIPQNSHKQ